MIPAELADAPYAIRYAWAAVRSQALPLPVSHESTGRYRRWTAAELAILDAEYDLYAAEGQVPALAARLKRTPEAVMDRMYRRRHPRDRRA